MRQVIWRLWGVMAVSLLVACQGRGLEGHAHAQSAPAPPSLAAPAGQPPLILPDPAPAYERWTLEPVGAQAPEFPLLPGEDPHASRSVGDVSFGYLINARQLRWPHPSLAVLPVQSRRHLNFTSDAMAAILEGASRHVQERFPESVTWLGNLSARGGGDIVYSVSHNSGRDADVAFFVTDESGLPALLPDLLSLDETGRYEGEHGVFLFDVARNWSLVEGLVMAGEGQIQMIFISTPLRQMLLEHAAQVEAPQEIQRAAARLLIQPRATLPHDDHFHVRIFCAPIDVASGCDDRGGRAPDYSQHARELSAALGAALGALDAPEPAHRAAGLRRLALLSARSCERAIAARLDDDAPLVRAAAARALAELGRGSRALSARLPREQAPEVRVELIDALGRLGDRVALDALIKALDDPGEVVVHDRVALSLRLMVIDALGYSESERPVEPLIKLLERADAPELRARIARALAMLTNHTFLRGWEHATELATQQAIEAWRGWLKAHRKKRREQWLVAGFQAAGHDIKRLDRRAIWPLCMAIGEDEHTRYNAQRVLMRLSGNPTESIAWGWEDANFYWRRWFERRRARFGLKPLPPALSTLKPQ